MCIGVIPSSLYLSRKYSSMLSFGARHFALLVLFFFRDPSPRRAVYACVGWFHGCCASAADRAFVVCAVAEGAV